MAGIVCGLLSPDCPPRPGQLREYFHKQLVRRQFGRINTVHRGDSGGAPLPAPGPLRVLCLSRGGTGPIVETALRQVARVAGCSSRLWVQPALRTASGKAGDGQSPLPGPATPALGLAAAAMVSRLCTNLRLFQLADYIMAGVTLRIWPQLCARARDLPGPSLVAQKGHTDFRLAQEPGKVLYHCFGATHSSVAGAAIHAGILRRTGQVTMAEVLKVPGFDRRSSTDIGHAFFVGSDETGCEAFAIGFNGARGVLTRAAADLLTLMGPGPRHVLLADTLSSVSVFVRLGGYLSRRWNLVAIGRKLAAYGIVVSAPRLQVVVANARAAVCEQARRAGDHALARAGCGNGDDSP